MIHLIPPGEESLHIESADCECNPEFDIDEESGEMIYTHLPLDIEILVLPSEDDEIRFLGMLPPKRS